MAKPNRNDPYPCGSGKRYKHCCGSVANPGKSVGGVAAEGAPDVMAGAAIAPCARRIVGIDLSANMLAKAKERNIYERLLQADLLPAMRDEPSATYDVVPAADVFVYLGRLDEVVAQAARLLRPGGVFAFSVEALEALAEGKRGDGQEFVLNDKGRFAHAAPYIERLAAANGLRLLELTGVQSRLEQGVAVQGWLVLMAR